MIFLSETNLKSQNNPILPQISAVQEQPSSSRTQSIAIDIESACITDEEKEKLKTNYSESANNGQSDVSNRPFLDTVLSELDCSENDYLALLALCLIYAMANNEGKKNLIHFAKFNVNA